MVSVLLIFIGFFSLHIIEIVHVGHLIEDYVIVFGFFVYFHFYCQRILCDLPC